MNGDDLPSFVPVVAETSSARMSGSATVNFSASEILNPVTESSAINVA
jgi:hypothetical protein